MTTKICSMCYNEKNMYMDFGSRQIKCKLCQKEYCKSYRIDNLEEITKNKKEYNDLHSNEIAEYNKKYYEENVEEISLRNKDYRETHSEEKKIIDREYKSKPENKKKRNDNQRKNRKENLSERLRHNISNQINKSLKNKFSSKRGQSIKKFLGEDYFDKLKLHLEKQFIGENSWMSLENYGAYNKDNKTWQLDHIKPHSDFNYETIDSQEFRDCWVLDNLRPLESIKNMSDGGSRIRHKNNTNKREF